MVAIVSIGDEVLYGFTQNSNAATLSQFLLKQGIIPKRQITIGDDLEEMTATLSILLKQGMTVITTGGLGPTCDDLTRNAAASLFSRKLVHSPECENALRSQYGNDLPTLKDQSIWPEGANLFPNKNGTAFGFCLKDTALYKDAQLICLPGPPMEMGPMLDASVKPLLPKNEEEVILAIHLAGLYEHEVDPYLRKLIVQFPNVQFGIYPSYGTLSVHLRAQKLFEQEAQDAQWNIQKQFSQALFTGDHGTIEEAVVDLMITKQLTISCAESCTGGALSSRLTSIPGVSQVFLGSIVSYSNFAKENLLEVPQDILKTFGAVSEETTEKMARGAQKQFGSSISIGVSGVFGPGGGTATRPIGTVCYSICILDSLVSGTRQFKGDRLTIREKAVQFLLIECFKQIGIIPSR